MSTSAAPSTPVHLLGRVLLDACRNVGDLTLFFLNMVVWLVSRRPRRYELLHSMTIIAVHSLPVVLLTGAFIGMVIAVQTYDQFRFMRMETSLGAAVNISLVKELGPVLAAVMLAGRVGSAMAAELGTMKITEQIDALRALGAHPVHYLVVPRFLACMLMIPLLTLFADGAGVCGGWFLGTQVLHIDNLHYWNHCIGYVGLYEIFSGAAKSMFFGASIGVIACHRGFNCDAGAQGVGRAATEAFVYSFVSILVLDFLLSMTLNGLYDLLWPRI